LGVGGGGGTVGKKKILGKDILSGEEKKLRHFPWRGKADEIGEKKWKKKKKVFRWGGGEGMHNRLAAEKTKSARNLGGKPFSMNTRRPKINGGE